MAGNGRSVSSRVRRLLVASVLVVVLMTGDFPAGSGFGAIAASAGSPTPGVVFSWGINRSGELGNGTQLDRLRPGLVSLAPGVSALAVSAGLQHSLAVGSDGRVYGWGDGADGKLGDGSDTLEVSPTGVLLAPGVSAVAVSSGNVDSLALGSDGNIYAFGWNAYGQLGDGTTTTRYVPTLVALPPGVTATAISAGNDGSLSSLAVGSDGKVYGWGDNTDGLLGDGTTTQHLTPVAVSLAPGVSATAVSMSGASSIALGSDGQVYVWGYLLTTGQDSLTPIPVALPGGISALAVSAGIQHMLVLGADGRVYAWGDDYWGELGDGGTAQHAAPVEVNLPPGVSITSISAGFFHSVAVATDGTIYGWGRNVRGQLGDGTTIDRHTPVVVATRPGISAATVTAGNDYTMAIMTHQPGTGGSVIVSPATRFGNSNERVSGSGWANYTDTSVAIRQCATPLYDANRCDVSDVVNATLKTRPAAKLGTFPPTQLTVRVGTVDAAGDTCGLTTSGTCYVVVTGDLGDTTSMPLAFAPPTASLAKSTNVVTNFIDKVRTKHFPIGDTVVAQQCDADAIAGVNMASHCDGTTAISGQVTPSGTVRFTPTGITMRTGNAYADIAAETCDSTTNCQIIVTDQNNPSIAIPLPVGFR